MDKNKESKPSTASVRQFEVPDEMRMSWVGSALDNDIPVIRNQYMQPISVQNREGLYMYQTQSEKREASLKLSKLENRIGLLKRKENAISRELKIRRCLDRSVRHRMNEFAEYKEQLQFKTD